MPSDEPFLTHFLQHSSSLVLFSLFLLLAMFLWTLADYAYRGLTRISKRNRSRTFVNLSEALVKRGAWDEVILLAEKFKTSPAGKVCLAGLQASRSPSEVRREHLNGAASPAARLTRNQIHEKMRSGLNRIATIATIAPLIGLFGTCTGILDSFGGGYIGSHDSFVSMLAGNLADALVPTAAGLVVGVAATWAFNWRTDCLSACDADMEIVCLALLEYSKTRAGLVNILASPNAESV